MKNKRKVMLINPPQLSSGEGMRRIMPPLGLLYVGTNLLKRGYNVDILDSPLEGYDNVEKREGGYVEYGLSDESLKKRVRDSSPDVVGISSSFSARHNGAKNISNQVRKITDAPIIMGGLHSNLLAEEIIRQKQADYVVLGEGEFRTPDLLDELSEGKIPQTEGIVYSNSGEAIFTGPPSPIKDLDSIPLPDRGLVDLERYFRIGLPFAPFSKSERAVQIFASRGCPMSCSFCSTKNYWGKYRARTVKNVLEEVRDVVEKHDVRELQFIDDNLTFNKRRSKELFSGLEKFGLNWCTPNGVMVNTLDKELIEAMARSGAYQLSFAIESASERVRRDLIGKRVPPKEKVRELVSIARDNGIQVHGLFVLGFPGEAKEEIEASFRYPYEVGFSSVAFFNLSPLPGSKILKQCIEKGYVDSGAAQVSNFKTPEIRIPENSPDYFGFSPEELADRIEEETQRFHEASRREHPEEWEAKFSNFNKIHKSDNLMESIH